MSKGWQLVARLGGSAARYPHVLVDAHGWCLRLGPVPRDDDKFYSRIETLLEGLVEHVLRRRFLRLGASLDPGELLAEARDALAAAHDQGLAAAERIVQESSVCPPASLLGLRPQGGPKMAAAPRAADTPARRDKSA